MKRALFVAGAAAASVGLSPAAQAHAPHIGPAGGQTIHWGSYHFELVPGANGSRIFVYRASDRKPVPTASMSANARLLAGGNLSTVRFHPAGGNMLLSPAARLWGDWTAVVSLRLKGVSPTIRYSARQLSALRRVGAKS
jgi:hypothetical protein